MRPAIRVDHISKLYRLGERKAAYRTLRESLTNFAAAPYDNLRKAFRRPELPTGEERINGDAFWALRDVSFDVQQGEVVGIIGRNGAGKSTLLKLLGRITEPTSGRIELRGRVSSLLEVGTGFHPELTGRENIHLNGSILGMRHHEIDRKFDEIVAFAGVEDFLDTPVKRYSSGMYVRQAFAVAAHLEPEILIVDEVLAVGDAEFQKKCLGKMQDVARHGRTVLFVSHNMAAVESLCGRCLLFVTGTIEKDGSPQKIIDYYFQQRASRQQNDLRNRVDRAGDGQARILRIQICDADGIEIEHATVGRPLNICINYTSSVAVADLDFTLTVKDHLDMSLAHFNSRCVERTASRPDHNMINCRIERFPLVPGEYRLNAAILGRGGHVYDHVENAIKLEVNDGDFFGTGRLPPTTHSRLLIDHTWVA